MPGLASFGLSDMIRCQSDLRRLGATATSMEEVASGVVDHLYDYLSEADGTPSTALIRLYKTHPYSDLPDDLKTFAGSALGTDPHDTTQCLTLLATTGKLDQWNHRSKSESHKAIPLPSPEVVNQSPMIAQLIKQFGLELETVVSPDPEIVMDLEQKTYNVFYVPQAEGSPYVPAQDFVTEHGVKSALGFGGLLPTGELFAVVLFSTQEFEKHTAELFQTVALSVKVALLPFTDGPVFS